MLCTVVSVDENHRLVLPGLQFLHDRSNFRCRLRRVRSYCVRIVLLRDLGRRECGVGQSTWLLLLLAVHDVLCGNHWSKIDGFDVGVREFVSVEDGCWVDGIGKPIEVREEPMVGDVLVVLSFDKLEKRGAVVYFVFHDRRCRHADQHSILRRVQLVRKVFEKAQLVRFVLLRVLCSLCFGLRVVQACKKVVHLVDNGDNPVERIVLVVQVWAVLLSERNVSAVGLPECLGLHEGTKGREPLAILEFVQSLPACEF